MKVTIDGVLYSINVNKGLLTARDKLLESAKKDNGNITLPNGKTIRFGVKSIQRLAVNSALAPVLIPMLESAFEAQGLELPPNKDRLDLLVYASACFLELMGSIERDVNLNAESIESDNGSSRIVTTISTIRQSPVESRDGGEQRAITEKINSTQST